MFTIIALFGRNQDTRMNRSIIIHTRIARGKNGISFDVTDMMSDVIFRMAKRKDINFVSSPKRTNSYYVCVSY